MHPVRLPMDTDSVQNQSRWKMPVGTVLVVQFSIYCSPRGFRKVTYCAALKLKRLVKHVRKVVLSKRFLEYLPDATSLGFYAVASALSGASGSQLRSVSWLICLELSLRSRPEIDAARQADT